jgi:alkanesulfonate monooxygenase SsuD/methylene tetrahydromethanopterin reductase-like flavin-dependent oxidoreductase (luciferase family)
MQERLGLGLIPGVGWRAAEITEIAKAAEDAGFDAVFAAEVNNDVLATVQLMGEATQRIKVGSWVANIYLRHPYVCAQAAALIADLTGGRMMLGLGVSHQPVNRALGIEMPSRSRRRTNTPPPSPIGCAARGRQPICHNDPRHTRCRYTSAR